MTGSGAWCVVARGRWVDELTGGPGPRDLAPTPRASQRGGEPSCRVGGGRSEAPGSHAPHQPAWRGSEASGRSPAPRDLAPTPRVSQPQKIAGNCRRDLRKVRRIIGVSSFFPEDYWCQFIFLGNGGLLEDYWCQFIFPGNGGLLVSVHFSREK